MKESEIAARHGLTLCDHCGNSRELHVGFDHGKRKCILARDRLDLAIHHRGDLDDVVRRLSAYSEEVGE